MDESNKTNSINSAEEEYRDRAEGFLNNIKEAIDKDPANIVSYENEFGDLTFAIPLGGDPKNFQDFITGEKVKGEIADTADWFISGLAQEKENTLTCGFVGYESEEFPWLSDKEDIRTKRLKTVIEAFTMRLSMKYKVQYLVGNSEGFDLLAAAAIEESNAELKTSKLWEGVPQDWEYSPIKVAVPYEGYNAECAFAERLIEGASEVQYISESKHRIRSMVERNIFVVDNSDLVVALFDLDNPIIAYVTKAIVHAARIGKAMFIISPRWLEDEWPDTGKLKTVPANYFINENANEA